MEGQRKILLVEDDPGSRKLLGLILRQSGYEVIEAVDGIEALARAQTSRLDLLILDLQLPGTPGEQVIRKFRANSSNARIPVIVTTSFDPEEQAVQSALTAGATKILPKPTSMQVFKMEVGRILSESL